MKAGGCWQQFCVFIFVSKFYSMATKDHKHVKNDDQYEALRDKGMSKERAAKISNSPKASKHGGEHSHGKKKSS